ncbi:MAG TPA: hypothetical protein VJ774_03050 [Actinomycetota bacterium]|nr:hypothetical protein [Actinomycetota bacterium]
MAGFLEDFLVLDVLDVGFRDVTFLRVACRERDFRDVVFFVEDFFEGDFLVEDDLFDEVFREAVFLDGDFLELDLLAVDVPEVERFAGDVRELVLVRLDFVGLGAFLPPAFAAFSLTFWETFSEAAPACSTAIVSILSATVRTRSCAASVESSFLPAPTAVSFRPVCFAIDPSSLSWYVAVLLFPKRPRLIRQGAAAIGSLGRLPSCTSPPVAERGMCRSISIPSSG